LGTPEEYFQISSKKINTILKNNKGKLQKLVYVIGDDKYELALNII